MHTLLARPALLALPAAAALLLSAGDLVARGAGNGAFDWGCRLRLRQEYTANATDFSEGSVDDNNYLRVRSQLWASWTPNAQWKLYAMLNNEHRHWYKSSKGLENQPFEIHELIFENLYVEAKGFGGTPFGFTIGRQNLFYGEGFVSWDGGPLDGSRTAYMNAAVVSGVFGKRRFDVHFISDPEKDEYLPVVNDQDQPLVEWDETGAGVYYTDESHEGLKVEGYYFYKNEKDGDNVYPESDVHTIGARFSGRSWIPRLTYAAEGAVQAGDRGSAKRLGVGAYLYGKETLPIERVPMAVYLGGIYLSGDEPATEATYEGWDPLYSRWPKWSELYIYSLAREHGAAYWDNLVSPWIGLDAKAFGRMSFEGRLYLMWAAEHAPSWASLFGSGYYRGTLSTLKLAYAPNDYLSGYLLWEAMQPGDYYADGSDTAHFLRWEIMFKY